MERNRSTLQKRWEERQALAPQTSYPLQLPITARKEENRPGNQEAPGTDHRGGNRLREIDPDPQDVP